MYEYSAKFLTNYDGDTIKFMVDLGFGILKKITVRLAGIDTPELRSKDKATKEKAYEARSFVFKKLADAKDIVVKTQKDKTGKYGRYIADVIVAGENLGDILVMRGLAVRVDY